MPDQRDMEDKGGTMRLGLYPARLTPGSKAAAGVRRRGHLRAPPPSLRGQQRVPRGARAGRHDPVRPVARRPAGGDRRAARTTRGSWPSQFHPEFKSRPDRPHPLFTGFVKAAIEQAARRRHATTAEQVHDEPPDQRAAAMTAVSIRSSSRGRPDHSSSFDPALVRARERLRAALLDAFAAIADDRLTCAVAVGRQPADVRYGFYRASRSSRQPDRGSDARVAGQPTSEARDAVGAAAASRWALHGVLATLTDADLDADPGDGEWTIRQTMRHIIGWPARLCLGQRLLALGPRAAAPRRSAAGTRQTAFAGHPEEDEEATRLARVCAPRARRHRRRDRRRATRR